MFIILVIFLSNETISPPGGQAPDDWDKFNQGTNLYEMMNNLINGSHFKR